MTSYKRTSPQPQGVEYLGYDHLHFWVGNAFQAAAYYITRFGFEPCAYRGLETNSREVTTHVVRQRCIYFAFSSPLEPKNQRFSAHLSLHGDGVRGLALRVVDCKASYAHALRAGAKSVKPPHTASDSHGVVTMATIASGCIPDLEHTLVQRDAYSGAFLPGYAPSDDSPTLALSDQVDLRAVDHCVVNVDDGELEGATSWYARVFGWHRFWSVDEDKLHTEYSALRSVVMTDYHERVKMPINEPAPGRRKSQIEEFIEYYGGAGVQHIALRTLDIVRTVNALRARGVAFISVPLTYYEDLRARLRKSRTEVTESLEELQRLHILVDFDESGYLLQTFTKPVQDRPTLFIEIIQRRSHQGFGFGNFKALFEAIERDQALRGNLT